MQLLRLTDTLTLVKAPVTGFFNTCHGLLMTGPQRVLIDGNAGRDNLDRLIREFGVEQHLATHFHLDHAVQVGFMMERLQGRVRVSAAEHPFFASLDYFIAHTGIGEDGLAATWAKIARDSYGWGDSPGAGVFGPGEVLDFGKNRFQVIALPGHSPGHLGFWEPDEKILFAVDIGLDRFGPWYGFNHCRLKEYLASIEELRRYPARLLLGSHSDPVAEADIRIAIAGLRSKIMQRHEAILRAVEKLGPRAEDLVNHGLIFPKDYRVPKPWPAVFHFWERTMIERHLEMEDRR
jgi:glyoxylase-like metal-dependent hydrolase (beta-lactamase superfamily II)